jgi:hypothetical protein
MNKRKKQYMFSIDISDNTENEFLIEFYPCLKDELPDILPCKVTKNFDELIDFFEQMDV